MQKAAFITRRFFAAAVFLVSLLAEEAWASPLSTNPNVNLDHRQQASRFLGQATCGPTQEEIDSLATALQKNPATAYADWIKREVEKPISEADLALPSFRTQFPPDYPRSGYRQQAKEASALRAGLMISSPLQLRQRVAWALSQIFVVSIQGDLVGSPEGLCDWQDTYRRDMVTLWSYATKAGLAPTNEALKTDRANQTDKPPGILTPDQAKAMLKASKDDDVRALHAIGLFAGLRVSELSKLDWKDVDLAGGYSGGTTIASGIQTDGGIYSDGGEVRTDGIGNLTASTITATYIYAEELRISPILQTASPTTGQTVTATANSNVTVYLTPAGTLATLTFSLPTDANSKNGQIVRLFTTQALTALTVNVAGSGTLKGTALTTLAANTGAAWQKVSSAGNGTWIRLY